MWQRVCQRAGCGRMFNALESKTKRFCSKQCLDQDKRERMAAQRELRAAKKPRPQCVNCEARQKLDLLLAKFPELACALETSPLRSRKKRP